MPNAHNFKYISKTSFGQVPLLMHSETLQDYVLPADNHVTTAHRRWAQLAVLARGCKCRLVQLNATTSSNHLDKQIVKEAKPLIPYNQDIKYNYKYFVSQHTLFFLQTVSVANTNQLSDDIQWKVIRVHVVHLSPWMDCTFKPRMAKSLATSSALKVTWSSHDDTIKLTTPFNIRCLSSSKD